MALINRVSRLFRADLHAVLDRIEEPDVLLRQSVREMETELERDERRLRWLQQEIEQATRQEKELQQSLKRIGEELDVCFKADEPELARAVVRRRLQCEQRIEQAVRQQETAVRESELLKQRTGENRTQLEQMQQKIQVMLGDLQRENDGVVQETVAVTDRFGVTGEEVEIAWLKELQARQKEKRRAS